jgi:xylose dehydrogenase (NAD/NADP)
MSINWGFIGAGMVATTALAPAVKAAKNATLYAVASMDINRARALNPMIAYDNYDALINDPKVDGVYISLPNHLHAHWTIKALQAGKHVLCEKPLAMNLDEAMEMFEVAEANQRLLVEAIWFRWHPRFIKAQEVIARGEIGIIKEITATFAFRNTSAGNYRFNPQAGGGSLLDLGPYLLHALVALTSSEVLLKINKVNQSIGPSGVDTTTSVNATVNNGLGLDIFASFEADEKQELIITGSKGTLTFPKGHAFTNWNEPSQLRVSDQIFDFIETDPYQIMIESTSASVAGEDSWIVPKSESIFVMKSLDLIREHGG